MGDIDSSIEFIVEEVVRRQIQDSPLEELSDEVRSFISRSDDENLGQRLHELEGEIEEVRETVNEVKALVIALNETLGVPTK